MKFGILAALAVALVPAAHAHSGCELIDKLVAGAGSEFASIRGEEIDDGWYETDVWLKDAEECTVEIGDKAVYDCAWSAPHEAAGRTWASALNVTAVKCLPGWTRSDITGKMSFNNLPIRYGDAFTRTDGKAVEVYVEVVDAKTTHIWFRVIGPTDTKVGAAPKPAITAAAPAPAPVAAPVQADTWTATPTSVNRVPPLTGLDYRYLSGAPDASMIYFIDQSSVQRFERRAYVWVAGTRPAPLNGALVTLTLREVACGPGAATRYIHSVPLGADFKPDGKSMPMEGWKFDPAVGPLKAIADIACDGVSLSGASYATPAEAVANRVKAAQAG